MSLRGHLQENLFWQDMMIFVVSVILSLIDSMGAKPLLNRKEAVTVLFMAGYYLAMLGMIQSPISGSGFVT